MSVQLNCTVCWDPLQEGDLTHIPHTDGTPENRRHFAEGIHSRCLRDWVIERYTQDQPITCPLGCADKLISSEHVLTQQELQNRARERWISRLSNWVYDRLAPPINREILLAAGLTGMAVGAILQTATNGAIYLVRPLVGQWISSSVMFIPGTGISCLTGAVMGTVAAYALSGQGEMGLRIRRIHGLSYCIAAVGSALGVISAQALLN